MSEPRARPPGRRETLRLLEAHGLRPSRALGQNFLVDPNTAERIARLARASSGTRVLEIGAGLGALTVALAATGAAVTAVEIDRRLLAPLRELAVPLGVVVIEADAFALEWGEVLAGERHVLVANLPYNIATPLVLGLLERVSEIDEMTVMVQREVAERLAAAPGESAYGAVSARIAYFATARIVMRVPPSVFLPRPKVDSAVIALARRAEPAVAPSVATYGEIDVLLRTAFSTRRKMLRRSLAGILDEAAFEEAGIDSSMRPEELGIEAWGSLAAARRSTADARR